MREHRAGDGLDVLGDDVVASECRRPRLRHAEERDSGPRARAEREQRALARVPDDALTTYSPTLSST